MVAAAVSDTGVSVGAGVSVGGTVGATVGSGISVAVAVGSGTAVAWLTSTRGVLVGVAVADAAEAAQPAALLANMARVRRMISAWERLVTKSSWIDEVFGWMGAEQSYRDPHYT
jgi:UDP-3-O-[3-hydroxymyristoyl] glucosamine N-acyltransferase